MIYSFGYQNYSYYQLVDKLKLNLISCVIDTRLNPYSYDPFWQKDYLSENLIKNNISYIHIKEFGNINYKIKNNIKINNFNSGLEKLDKVLLNNKNVALMCACKDYNSCHRKVLVEMLKNVTIDEKFKELLDGL